MNHTWNVVEQLGFGNHPEQILFLEDPGSFNTANHAVCIVVGACFTQVRYQRMSDGRVAIRSGNITPYSNTTYMLVENMPPFAPGGSNEVMPLTLGGSGLTAYYEFKNGLAGVRVHAGLGSATIATVRAPIQGLQMADGNWTPSGNTLITLKSGGAGNGSNISLSNITVSNIDVGPLVTTLRVTYRGNVPAYGHGSACFPANSDGNFTCDVQLRAGEKTIRVEHVADYLALYRIPLWATTFHPDRIRWNGLSASTQSDYTSVGYLGNTSGLDGWQANGTIAYGNPNFGTRSYWAVGEIHFVGTFYSTFNVSSANITSGERPYTTAWPMFLTDAGWWHAAYDSAGADDSNMVGYCVGPVSRMVGGTCGIGFDYVTGSGANISINTERYTNSTSGANATLGRHAFGIVMGRKRDTYTPGWYSEMSRITNLVGGVCFDSFKDYKYDWTDSPAGKGNYYLSASSIATMKSWWATEGQWHDYANNSGSNFWEDVGQIWSDNDGSGANIAYQSYGNMARFCVDLMVSQGGLWGSANGNGIAGRACYDELAYSIDGQVQKVDLLLGHGNHPPAWDGSKKQDLKHLAAFTGGLIWDPNFGPLDEDGTPYSNYAGSLGTQEQVFSFVTHRNAIAYLFNADDDWADRGNIAVESALVLLNASIDANGFLDEPPDYGGTAVGYALNLLRNYRVTGNSTPFTDGQIETLANWFLNMHSPPDRRFKATFGNDQANGVGLRKYLVFGDALIRSTPYTAELATIVQLMGNTTFAKRLYGAWREGRFGSKLFSDGSPFVYGPHSSFAGTSVVKVDDPAYTQAYLPPHFLPPVHYAGQITLMRSVWDRSTECCLAISHGEGWGPSHAGNDAGVATIFALQFPVSTEWASYTYAPSVRNPYAWSTAVPTGNIVGGWTVSNVPIGDSATPWAYAGSTAFFFKSGQAGVHVFTAVGNSSNTWTRIGYFIQAIVDKPMFMFVDSFGGAYATGNKVITQTFHNGNISPANNSLQLTPVVGPIVAGVGNLTLPEYRHVSMGVNGGPSFRLGNDTLPAGTHHWQVSGLNIGTANLGLDYDMYVKTTGNTTLWGVGHWSHSGAYSQESQENYAATGMFTFFESQYLFRLHTNGDATTLILPRRKGEPSPTVTENSGLFTVSYADGSIQYINNNAFAAFTSDARALASGGGADITIGNLTIFSDSGSVEIVAAGPSPGNFTHVFVTAHGATGLRHIKVDSVTSGVWIADPNASGLTPSANDSWSANYTAGAPVTYGLLRA